MTVGDMLAALEDVDPRKRIVISNVKMQPFAVLPIREVLVNKIYEDEPVYVVAKQE